MDETTGGQLKIYIQRLDVSRTLSPLEKVKIEVLLNLNRLSFQISAESLFNA